MEKEEKIVDVAFLNYLLNYITENKKNLFQKVLNQRTRHITVALEDIYQPQNASAVLRSADCFGVQDIHIIENRNKYNINPHVVQGASKWVSLHYYNQSENNTLDCINALKAKGYKIVATTPHTNDVTIDSLDISQPVALFFGTELTGISDVVKKHADEFVKIPMSGFTESFNISVSAAICLYELTKRLRASGNINWQLSEEEKQAILLDWAKKVIKRSEVLERDFYKHRIQK